MPEPPIPEGSRRCWISLKDDFGKFIRNSESISFDMWFLSLDKVGSVSWSSNQADESKSVCLLKLSLVSRKNGRSFRGKSETERSDLWISTIKRVCRIVWNRWGANWVRVEQLSRIHIDPDSQTCSASSACLTNRSRTVWGNNLVHVDVQRHWLSQKSMWPRPRFPRGYWSLFALRDEAKWYGTCNCKPERK